MKKSTLKYIAVALGAIIIILVAILVALLINKFGKKKVKPVTETLVTTEAQEETTLEETTTEIVTPLEETTTVLDETLEVTTEEETTVEETTIEETTEEVLSVNYPSIPESLVKQMIRKGLTYVQMGYGYSLNDRVGQNGNFDCSGFVASLLYTEFNCPDFYLNGNAYTTGDWRAFGSRFNIGDEVMFGVQKYKVTMKDTEDYISAWSVPGSIVVQYSPTNHPEKTMGHISIALGNLPYESTEDIVKYLYNEYGVELSGTTITGLPMVYDQYGKDSGHTIFKINAQSVANCCIVDNNFASDPEWIEPVAIVFEPVFE